MDYEKLTKDQLPQEFQDRIERFNRLFKAGTDHSFEEDGLYGYEMGCIAQALSFAEYFKDVSADDIVKMINERYGSDVFELIRNIKDNLPFFDEGHSGNSLSMSWQLFMCYKSHPDLIPYMHGCLATLVGDEGYYDDRSDIPKFE